MLAVVSAAATQSASCAGSPSTPDGHTPQGDPPCHAERPLASFLDPADDPTRALDAWWSETTLEAASLFHGTDVRSPERREFFAEHVFTEHPSLVVGDDAFLLSESFVLAIADTFAQSANGNAEAIRWIDRAEQTVAVLRCRNALEAEAHGAE